MSGFDFGSSNTDASFGFGTNFGGGFSTSNNNNNNNNDNNNQQQQIGWKTPFEQLPTGPKTRILQLEKTIKQQMNKSDQISSIVGGCFYPIENVRKAIEENLDTIKELSRSITEYQKKVDTIRGEVRSQIRNAEIGQQKLTHCNVSSSYSTQHQLLNNNSPLPAPFFRDLLSQFEQRIQQYQKQIAEIEQYLALLHAGNNKSHSPQVLRNIMWNQYRYFMALSSQISMLHESVQSLKELFIHRFKLSSDFFEKKKSTKGGKTKKEKLILPPPTPAAKQPQQQQQNSTNSGFGGGFGDTSTSGGGFGGFGDTSTSGGSGGFGF